MLGDKKYCEV